jgi:transcription-repair coupling factor (superfamily II helicase)
MYERANVLTQEGNQRLNAIKEFTNLGSGYKIAVRDLAIRGAGDFLGKEQSGYIDAIGMDMYIKLLNESISEIKGIKEEKPVENNNFIEISKHIDDNYVSDDDIKIYIHKIINSINTKEDKDYVINELNDRFGKINDEILLYINKQYLDSLLKKYDIIELNTNDFKVKMVFSKESSEKIGGQKMMETIILSKNSPNKLVTEKKVFGFDHTEVGYHIGMRWDLPKQIISIMKYHHKPFLSDFKMSANIIYLADRLVQDPLRDPIVEPEMEYKLGFEITNMEGFRKQVLEKAKLLLIALNQV